MNKLFFYIILFFISTQILAQNITITGKVIDGENNQPLPGVTIRNSDFSIGTITNFEGIYIIQTINKIDSLYFSFIGYKTVTVALNEKAILNIKMYPESISLNDIVVTALGIKREKKSLGYSVQEINNEVIGLASEINVMNKLSGKVSGLSVISTSGGSGSSNRIVLRGTSSLEKNNQVLFVVDGVPIENNTQSNTEDTWGGRDYGNGISDINSEDIESISVLKGASAAALYGSRAANGVILITTKNGKKKNGLGISFSSSTNIEKAYILYDFQNEYGAGRNGKFIDPWSIENGIPVFDNTSSSSYGSWGPKMEGQTIIDWDGQTRTFSPQPNNYNNYFQTGITINNSVSIESGDEISDFRFTFSNLNNSDIIPGSSLKRNNFSLKSNYIINDKIKFESFVTYINQKADNRVGMADLHTSVSRNYIQMPRNISNESLENNIMNEYGEEQTWYMNWNWMTNPYWNKKYELNNDVRNRIIGNFAIKFELPFQINAMLRAGTDFNVHDFESIDAYNGLISKNGGYQYKTTKAFENNFDGLLSYNTKISDFGFSTNLGGNIAYSNGNNTVSATKNGLSIPYFYSIGNSKYDPVINTWFYEKISPSLYGIVQLSYKSILFLDVTGRNDWSSTLPKKNNSYFYPSMSLGFVFSDLLNLNSSAEKIFPFGKLRFSLAKVGNDTDPYRLFKEYILNNSAYGHITYVSNEIPPIDLKPEEMKSIEVGTNLRFMQNKIEFDAAYFKSNTINQIIGVSTSATSGSRRALINAGNIENKGIELQLVLKPINKKDISWETILNYTKINSRVIALANGVDTYTLLSHWGLSIEARPGNNYGDIVGYAIKRDENGNKLLFENGLYIRSDSTQILGNINPDFSLSLNNSLRWKFIRFSFLIDAKFGGDIFSGTNMYGYGYSGNFTETLTGRAEWYESEKIREAAGISAENWEAIGGFLANGIYVDGTVIDGEDVSGQTNTTYIDPYKYWSQFSDWTNEIHEPFVYDASYIKLREISIHFTLPKKWFQNIIIQSASIGFSGTNLFLIYSNIPNIDPESTHTNGNGQGYELYTYPQRRTFGFHLNVKF